MTILLDTGSLTNPNAPQVTVGNVTIDNTPSERVVYPRTKEQFLVVKTGEMLVLTAYGLVADKAIVKKVLLSNGIPELATGRCNPVITSAQSTVLNRVEIPCFEITPCSPITVIDIPGVYSVVPEGTAVDVVITAVSHPLQQGGPKCGCATKVEFEV